MRCPLLFALMVAGSVTAASAEPKQEEISERVSLNENADQKTDVRQPGEWVELATPTPAKHGTEFIMVGENAGTFSKLRIDGTTGRTNVVRVKVYFADGEAKTVRLDRALHPTRDRSAFVDLGEPRLIDRVVITTETHTKGKYALYGSSSSEELVGSR